MRSEYSSIDVAGRRSARRRLVLASAALLIVFVPAAWWSGMNYAGYCHRENRFLSDQEFIDIAVELALQRYPFTVPIYENVNGEKRMVDIRMPANSIRYANTEEFWRENPNCCALVDEVPAEKLSIGKLDRLLGSVATFVVVKLKLK
jgi:hypothetical protein